MLVFGLTGGIATGKSTVSALLRARAVEVIDADIIAREVVAPGQPALADIARAFPDMVDGRETLDRKRLGSLVFQDSRARARLNAIVHPRIQKRFKERLALLRDAPFVVYDAALLIENKLHEQLDGVVLVTLPYPQQLARLMARDKLEPDVARARIAMQMPVEEKLRFATWEIDNSGTIAETTVRVEAVLEEMRKRV